MEETGFNVSVNQLTLEEFLLMHPSIQPALDYPSAIHRTRRNSNPSFGIYQSHPYKGKWPWKGNGHGTIQEPFATLSNLLQVRFFLIHPLECSKFAHFECRS